MSPRPMPEGFPKLKGEGREWNCRADNEGCSRQKPCRSCLGRRNRRSGMTKQRAARKALETVTGASAARFVGQLGNEELWGFGVRVEAKSGAQVGPIATRFKLAEEQSAAAKSVGDARPFAMAAMPKGWGSDGIFLCRFSQLSQVVQALMEVQ